MVFSFHQLHFNLERSSHLERVERPLRGREAGWMRLISWNLFAYTQFSERGCGPRQADAAVLENIGIFPLSPGGRRNGRRAPYPPGPLPHPSFRHEITKY
ncbi:hypothetical protein RPHASCH2410_CH03010 [Rhizobium phaseoli Ch24-10]|nr:hypothetical protein RPHASCH2410_CH03010 [Rhizobium phaseoli Ch24-10]